MTRRDPDFRFADEEFETLLRQTRAAQIADLDAGWDFDAGLADVYARAGQAPPAPAVCAASGMPAGAPGDGRQETAGSALADVCSHIEMIDALLATVSKIGDGPILQSSYLAMARQYLMRLRIGLLGRRLTAMQASGLISTVSNNLREADRSLRLQHGRSLEQALNERIGELREINTDLSAQVEILHDKVMRLFNDADEPAPLAPVPY